jgi:hypothetical protein
MSSSPATNARSAVDQFGIIVYSSSNDGPLLTGPVRAYKDHKARQIVIETFMESGGS